MLAIGRILRTGADFLLLDEPTEGLAPVIVQQIGAMIRLLKQKGYTILLVEQNFHFASTVADRHYVVEHGKVIDTIAGDQLQANIAKLERSEEHTSELQSIMRNSYAVLCLKKKTTKSQQITNDLHINNTKVKKNN